MKQVCLVIFLAAITVQVSSLNVLSFLPFVSKSHFAIGHAISKAIHKSGHEVTVVSPYPQEQHIEKLHKIKYVSTVDILEDFTKSNSMVQFSIDSKFSLQILFSFRSNDECI